MQKPIVVHCILSVMKLANESSHLKVKTIRLILIVVSFELVFIRLPNDGYTFNTPQPTVAYKRGERKRV